MARPSECEAGESRNEKDMKIADLRHKLIVDLPAMLNEIDGIIACVKEDEELINDKPVQYQLKYISDFLSEFKDQLKDAVSIKKGLDNELYRIFGMRVFPGA